MLRFKSTLSFLAVLLAFMGSSSSLWATHISNGRLSYTCLGGNTYEVTLELYRDCAAVAAPSTAIVSYSAPGCSSGGGTLSLTSQGGSVLPAACAAATTCNGGSLTGYERHVYTGTVVLPASCSNWRFSYNICCRTSELNFSNTFSFSLYLEATLDNTVACNSSPTISNNPEIYSCVNQPLAWSPQAVDADGDSLVFELQAPLGGSNVPLTFAPSFSLNNPLPTNQSFFFDTQTGSFSTHVSSAGNYLLAVLIKEYRNGTLIGTSIREVGINVSSSCATAVPSFAVQNPSNLTLGTGGGVATTCSNSFSFDMLFTDTDMGDTLNVVTMNLDALLGPGNYTFSATGGATPMGGYQLLCSVNVLDASALDSLSAIRIMVQDNNCPFPNTVEGQLLIANGPGSLSISSSADSVCTGLSSVLTATAGFQTYAWSTGETTPSISVSTAGSYILTATGACGTYSSTITVGAYPELSLDLGADETIPLNSSVDLYIEQSNQPFQNVFWSPSTGLSCTACDTTVATPTVTTDYIVQAESAQGCVASDTLSVNVFFNDATDTITQLIQVDSLFPNCVNFPAFFNPDTYTASPQYGTINWVPSSPNCFTYVSDGTPDVQDNFLIIACESATGYCDTTVVQVSIGSCVWAGDTDTDQAVNNFDLLPIGLGMGQTGLVRPNADLNFDCEPVMPWVNATPGTGINYKHSDTDGNGLINAADTTAIGLNWGQFYQRNGNGSSSSTGAPFFVQPQSTVPAQQVSLPVILGDMTTPVANAYGIAFTVNYDASMVEQGSVSLQYAPSWLGTAGTNLLGMYRDYPATGQIEIALTRTDGQSTAGFGPLCHIDLTIKDDIMRNNTERLDFSISNVRLIDAQGTVVPTSPQTTQVLIDITNSTQNVAANTLRMFPNPANDYLQLQSTEAAIEGVEVWNSLGQLVQTWKGTQEQLRLNTSSWSSGWYLIRVQSSQGWEKQRVQIMR